MYYYSIEYVYDKFTKRMGLTPMDFNYIYKQCFSYPDLLKIYIDEYIFNKYFRGIEGLHIKGGRILPFFDKEKICKILKRTTFSAIAEQLNGNLICVSSFPVRLFSPLVKSLLLVEIIQTLSIGLDSIVIPVITLDILKQSEHQGSIFVDENNMILKLNDTKNDDLMNRLPEKIIHKQSGKEFSLCKEKSAFIQLSNQFKENPVQCRFNIEIQGELLNKCKKKDIVICEIVGIQNDICHQKFKIVAIIKYLFLVK